MSVFRSLQTFALAFNIGRCPPLGLHTGTAMLFVLLSATLVQATPSARLPVAAVPCSTGTQLRLRETVEPHLALQQRISGPRITYLATRTIKSVDALCTFKVAAFDPNSSGARLSTGGYIWFRERTRPAAIAGSPVFGTGDDLARPTIGLDTARACDAKSVASTTFGPFSSCVSLYRDRGGSRVLITSRAPGAEPRQTDVKLPGPVRYEAISAGGWVHDVGGEIALIREGDARSAIVDIYRLSGS